jgi:hypothetical protein
MPTMASTTLVKEPGLYRSARTSDYPFGTGDDATAGVVSMLRITSESDREVKFVWISDLELWPRAFSFFARGGWSDFDFTPFTSISAWNAKFPGNPLHDQPINSTTFPRPTPERMMARIFALTGFILNWFAVGTCDFVHLALTYGSSAAPDAISLHFGIWSYQAWTVVTSLGGSVVFQGCWRYPEYNEFGESMQWSRAASSIALIITLEFEFADFLSVCTVTGRRITSPFVQCIGYMTASIFMGLSLLILNSYVCNKNDLSDQFQALFPNVAFDQASCTIARGAKCAISATVFYFLAGASYCVASRVEKFDAKKDVIPSLIDATASQASYWGLWKNHKEYRWSLMSLLMTYAAE